MLLIGNVIVNKLWNRSIVACTYTLIIFKMYEFRFVSR